VLLYLGVFWKVLIIIFLIWLGLKLWRKNWLTFYLTIFFLFILMIIFRCRCWFQSTVNTKGFAAFYIHQCEIGHTYRILSHEMLGVTYLVMIYSRDYRKIWQSVGCEVHLVNHLLKIHSDFWECEWVTLASVDDMKCN
jgi:hypothetical protein